MQSGIHSHDDLLRLAKDISARYGWEAKADNVGVDPVDTDCAGNAKQTPARGDLVLTNPLTGAVTTFEYGLPEYRFDIIGQIKSVIIGEKMDRDRRNKKTGVIEIRR